MANFAEHRSSHKIQYRKMGDYGKEIPVVVPVVYTDSKKVRTGTCERCVFGYRVPHSSTCVSIEAAAMRIGQQAINEAFDKVKNGF